MATVYHVEKFLDPTCPGLDVVLETPWTIWVQSNKTINGKKQSPVPMCKFNTIAGFWTVINNIKTIPNHTRLIFMREGICPVWEDPKHLNGGYFIVTHPPKTIANLKPLISNKNDNFYDLFIRCLLGVLGETFTNINYNSANITGITCINEPNLKQIRFWLSDCHSPPDERTIADEYLRLFRNIEPNLSKIINTIRFDKLQNKKENVKSTERRTGITSKRPNKNFGRIAPCNQQREVTLGRIAPCNQPALGGQGRIAPIIQNTSWRKK